MGTENEKVDSQFCKGELHGRCCVCSDEPHDLAPFVSDEEAAQWLNLRLYVLSLYDRIRAEEARKEQEIRWTPKKSR